jgi:UPF0755 protein
VKSFLFTVLFLSLSAALLVGFFFLSLTVPSHGIRENVEVKVERGESFYSVVRKLKDKGVIPNEGLFTFWARLRTLDKKIHWGLYRFQLPMAPQEVLDQMILGRGVFHRITIPEGFTLNEIAELLERQGLAGRKEFLSEVGDPETLSMSNLEGKGVEGYLFPDTYHFPSSASERDILIAMVEQFRRKFGPDMDRQAIKLGLSRHEVVTLASLVEKETGVAGERPLIAAVFHNRLQSGIRLQSDPTVIYGLKDFKGNLTRKDLKSASPYNTYRIHGLPPGPICNPGLPSIRAALYPASVPDLYFVSKNDGTHFFSTTIREHNRAVNIYQRGRRRPPRG